MRYVPSPIPFKYRYMYSATANSSGRMQYHRVKPGVSKVRISRTEFISTFNNEQILAIRPIPEEGNDQYFQLEFYI